MRADLNTQHAVKAISKVFVDGKEIGHCVGFDTHAGIVQAYEVDDKGELVVIDEFLQVVEFKGKVRIELEPGWHYSDFSETFYYWPEVQK